MKLGSDIKQAIESLALDKGVDVDSMYEALVSAFRSAYMLSLIHISRCRRYAVCRSRWSPYQ